MSFRASAQAGATEAHVPRRSLSPADASTWVDAHWDGQAGEAAETAAGAPPPSVDEFLRGCAGDSFGLSCDLQPNTALLRRAVDHFHACVERTRRFCTPGQPSATKRPRAPGGAGGRDFYTAVMDDDADAVSVPGVRMVAPPGRQPRFDLVELVTTLLATSSGAVSWDVSEVLRKTAVYFTRPLPTVAGLQRAIVVYEHHAIALPILAHGGLGMQLQHRLQRCVGMDVLHPVVLYFLGSAAAADGVARLAPSELVSLAVAQWMVHTPACTWRDVFPGLPVIAPLTCSDLPDNEDTSIGVVPAKLASMEGGNPHDTLLRLSIAPLVHLLALQPLASGGPLFTTLLATTQSDFGNILADRGAVLFELVYCVLETLRCAAGVAYPMDQINRDAPDVRFNLDTYNALIAAGVLPAGAYDPFFGSLSFDALVAPPAFDSQLSRQASPVLQRQGSPLPDFAFDLDTGIGLSMDIDIDLDLDHSFDWSGIGNLDAQLPPGSPGLFPLPPTPRRSVDEAVLVANGKRLRMYRWGAETGGRWDPAPGTAQHRFPRLMTHMLRLMRDVSAWQVGMAAAAERSRRADMTRPFAMLNLVLQRYIGLWVATAPGAELRRRSTLPRSASAGNRDDSAQPRHHNDCRYDTEFIVRAGLLPHTLIMSVNASHIMANFVVLGGAHSHISMRPVTSLNALVRDMHVRLRDAWNTARGRRLLARPGPDDGTPDDAVETLGLADITASNAAEYNSACLQMLDQMLSAADAADDESDRNTDAGSVLGDAPPETVLAGNTAADAVTDQEAAAELARAARELHPDAVVGDAPAAAFLQSLAEVRTVAAAGGARSHPVVLWLRTMAARPPEALVPPALLLPVVLRALHEFGPLPTAQREAGRMAVLVYFSAWVQGVSTPTRDDYEYVMYVLSQLCHERSLIGTEGAHTRRVAMLRRRSIGVEEEDAQVPPVLSAPRSAGGTGCQPLEIVWVLAAADGVPAMARLGIQLLVAPYLGLAGITGAAFPGAGAAPQDTMPEITEILCALSPSASATICTAYHEAHAEIREGETHLEFLDPAGLKIGGALRLAVHGLAADDRRTLGALAGQAIDEQRIVQGFRDALDASGF